MKILLDTHVFLWYISDDERLPAAYRIAIQNSQNDVHLSIASVWEAIIKSSIGKLQLPDNPGIYLPKQRALHGIKSLEITDGAMTELGALPLHHRDPFDRMLVAQAIHEKMSLATVDSQLSAYSALLLPK
jgi:PIN domain nuclease of toxin-antitoxin system